MIFRAPSHDLKTTMAWVGLAIVVFGSGVATGCVVVRKQADREMQAARVESMRHKEAAEVARKEAEAHAAKDAVLIQASQVADRKVADADRRVAEARAALERIRAAQSQQDPAPGAPDPLPFLDSTAVDLAAVVAKQDELIAALDAKDNAREVQLQAVNAVNANLRLECAAWKRDADESRARSGALEVVVRAKSEALTATRWQGRFEGGATAAVVWALAHLFGG